VTEPPDGTGPGWLALLGTPRPGSVPVADADTGGAAGHLLLAAAATRPDPAAVGVEAGLRGDDGGPVLAVSLVLPPPGTRPLFDDPAVVHALRTVLRDPARAPVLSTFVDGPTHWAGALSGVDAAGAAARPGWWDEDPFARLGPRRRLLVPPGVLRARPLPPGPCHQRHAGAPWPWGRFATR
jgi:hypothetical protein